MIRISKLVSRILYKSVEPQLILYNKMSMNRKITNFQQISLREIISNSHKKVAFINAKLSRGQASLTLFKMKYISDLILKITLINKGKTRH